jgi:hypothetical protein
MRNILVILLLFFAGIIGWISTDGKKSQIIRLIDIFAYGPLMIYIGSNQENIYYSIVLYFFGMTTIAYNLRNYISIKRNL